MYIARVWFPRFAVGHATRHAIRKARNQESKTKESLKSHVAESSETHSVETHWRWKFPPVSGASKPRDSPKRGNPEDPRVRAQRPHRGGRAGRTAVPRQADPKVTCPKPTF